MEINRAKFKKGDVLRIKKKAKDTLCCMRDDCKEHELKVIKITGRINNYPYLDTHWSEYRYEYIDLDGIIRSASWFMDDIESWYTKIND
jgi:hypothetical protein